MIIEACCSLNISVEVLHVLDHLKTGLVCIFFLFPWWICLSVLFLFPLSEGLYHCCTAIIEKSREDTWQMFGERCFQINLCVCERLCYSWPLSLSVEFVYCTTEAAEKKHIKHEYLGP